MLFNYNAGLKETFDRKGAFMPGQIAKTGWKRVEAINTKSTDPRIEFGQVVKRKVENKVPYAVAIEASDTADKIYGIAVRDVVSQSQVTFGANTVSYIHDYAAGQGISVMREGYIAVPVQKGTPQIGGKVYVRITASDSNTYLPIGGIEAEADGVKTIELPNAEFVSDAYFPMNGTSVAPTENVATSQVATIFIRL